MGINLQKGQRIDLTKGNAGLTKLVVGLGWDPIEKSKGGLLGSLFSFGGGSRNNCDCDAAVFMLHEDGKLHNKEDIIYFGNLRARNGEVIHTGDNLTGEGDGDDEQLLVDLSRVQPSIYKLVFVVNIYECKRRGQDFGMIENAFIRIVNSSNNQEIIRYNLTEDYRGKTSLMVGEIYRYENEWKFAAIGEGTMEGSLGDIARRLSC